MDRNACDEPLTFEPHPKIGGSTNAMTESLKNGRNSHKGIFALVTGPRVIELLRKIFVFNGRAMCRR